MSKKIAWLAVLPALIWLGGCAHNSEARVNVRNTGVRDIVVTLDFHSTTIAVGQTDTLALSWPGKDSFDVELIYFPVGQPGRVEYVALILNPGDSLNLDLGFAS